MVRAALTAFIGFLLISSSDDKIDESLLKGAWVMGDFKCGSEMEIIFRDGLLGNPIPETHELHKYSDFYGIVKVVSAKREGDEITIQLQSIYDLKDPIYTIVYQVEKNKYIAIRTFPDERLAVPHMKLSDMNMTHCRD